MQRLASKASFAKEITCARHCDNAFLTVLGYHGKLHVALFDVEDRIGRVSLGKHGLAPTIRTETAALADHGEKRLRIERLSAFGCHDTTWSRETVQRELSNIQTDIAP